MSIYAEAEEMLAKKTGRRRALSLKNLIPDVKSAAATAMNLDLLCKGNDVYCMMLNGIEASQRAQEAYSMIRGSDFVRNLINDKTLDVGKDLVRFNRDFNTEIGPSSLAESAKDGEVLSTWKMGDTILEADRFMFAANMLTVITTYIQVWMTIAGGWAEAKASVLEDNAGSGLSRGVVLGANDCGPHYASQFWMFAKPNYPAYHEIEASARNVYNLGFVAGYAAGKDLTRNQKGNIFSYLHSNLSDASQKMYSGNFASWSLSEKKSYYIDLAAVFRANLIED